VSQVIEVNRGMKTADNHELRTIFETRYGRRVSDATWYRIKKVFSDDFPATKQNVIWVADIKKQIPHCDLRLACFIENIKRVQQYLTKNQDSISGETFLNFLREKEIEIHKNTITKWFRPVNGFRRSRIYTTQELKPVILSAFTYKLRRDNSKAFESLMLANK